jgi:single-strand DNA-binding protein
MSPPIQNVTAFAQVMTAVTLVTCLRATTLLLSAPRNDVPPGTARAASIGRNAMPAINVTVVGNLARDPDLKNIGADTLATFTVASRSRYKNDDGEWQDGTVSWVRCCACGGLADHVAESLHKGDRVIVHGTLRQRDYENVEGGQRTVWEVTADDADRTQGGTTHQRSGQGP